MVFATRWAQPVLTPQIIWKPIIDDGTLSADLSLLHPFRLSAALSKASGIRIVLPDLPMPDPNPTTLLGWGQISEFHKQVLYYGYIIPALINQKWFKWDSIKKSFYWDGYGSTGQMDHAYLSPESMPLNAKGQVLLGLGYAVYKPYSLVIDPYQVPRPFFGSEDTPLVSDNVILLAITYVPILETDPVKRAQIAALTQNVSGGQSSQQLINQVGEVAVFGTVAIGGAVTAYGALAGGAATGAETGAGAVTEAATSTETGAGALTYTGNPLLATQDATFIPEIAPGGEVLGTEAASGSSLFSQIGGKLESLALKSGESVLYSQGKKILAGVGGGAPAVGEKSPVPLTSGPVAGLSTGGKVVLAAGAGIVAYAAFM